MIAAEQRKLPPPTGSWKNSAPFGAHGNWVYGTPIALTAPAEAGAPVLSSVCAPEPTGARGVTLLGAPCATVTRPAFAAPAPETTLRTGWAARIAWAVQYDSRAVMGPDATG